MWHYFGVNRAKLILQVAVLYSTTEISSIFAGLVEAAMPALKAAGSSTKSSYSREPFFEFSAVPFLLDRKPTPFLSKTLSKTLIN
jgi:hypothetical protein